METAKSNKRTRQEDSQEDSQERKCVFIAIHCWGDDKSHDATRIEKVCWTDERAEEELARYCREHLDEKFRKKRKKEHPERRNHQFRSRKRIGTNGFRRIERLHAGRVEWESRNVFCRIKSHPFWITWKKQSMGFELPNLRPDAGSAGSGPVGTMCYHLHHGCCIAKAARFSKYPH
jgi:hypothetical protein